MNEQVSLSYLLAHLDVASASFERPLALALLLLVPLFFLIGARLPWRRARVLRATAFVLLVLALAGLRLSALLPESRLSLIAAVDMSDSIDADGRAWAQRYVQSLAASLPPGDALGVIQFAADAAVLQAPAPASQLKWTSLPVLSTSTNLATAIDASLALFPPDTERRLVLVTDGNETRGNSLSKIPSARFAGVAIFAAVPPRAGGPDVAVDKVAVPPVVTQGSVFPVRVVVRNDAGQRAATLELSVDGESVGTETIELRPGLNAAEIPYQLRAAGSQRLRARVTAAGDTIAGNNFRDAAITVSGKAQVLLVTPRRHSALAQALRRKALDVVSIGPGELPASPQALLGYHAVIFDGVTAKSFGKRSLDVIESYVRDFGGGFIMVGGERSFGDADFKGTALERVLPVTLEPRKPPQREREPLALFLMIDRSKSMGYHFRNRFELSENQSKLVYAKRAALGVVRQLRDSDRIGLVVFDSLAFEIAPLRPLRDNRIVLERDIPRLQMGGGTDFYDGLQTALRQLSASRATNAHVILMTDGNTNRPASEHDELIAALAKAKITVTTIRIGDDQEDVSLLKKISQHTGGSFYQVDDAQALPELLLKDSTRQVLQTPQGEQVFVPRVDAPSQLLRGIASDEIPLLSGYAYARAQPNADVLVHVAGADKKDPVLATWQYGLGRVVAFTADFQDDAEAWVGWSGFGKLGSQAVHWAAPAHTPNDFAVQALRHVDSIEMRVDGFADLGSSVLSARLVGGAHPIDVPLVPVSARRFIATLPKLPGGRYNLALSVRQAGGSVRQRTQSITIPAADDASQEEFERLHPNLPLLQRLTTESGGAVDAPIRTITGRQPGTRRVDHRLDWWLLPLAMLLFLADIAQRRFAQHTG